MTRPGKKKHNGQAAARRRFRRQPDDTYTARSRHAMRQALEVPLEQRDPDPRIAQVLRLVAAAWPPRGPGEGPVDLMEFTRWFVGMFKDGRGIDLDLLACAADLDVADAMVSYAYRDMEGTC